MKKHISYLICGMGSGFLFMVAVWKYGVGIGPDSISYMTAANHLLAFEPITSYAGKPYVSWPLVYPILIALMKIVFHDSVWGITFLHLAGYLFYSLLLFYLLKNIQIDENNRSFLNFIFIGLSIFSYPLFIVAIEAYSEIWFVLFLLASFAIYLKYLEDNTNGKLLWGLSLLSTLSFHQRYIGLTLLLTISILLLHHHKSLKTGLKTVVYFLILPCISMGLWLFRNYLITGTLTGVRSEPYMSALQNGLDGLIVISKWFFPHFLGDGPRLILLFFMVFGAFFLLIKHSDDWSHTTRFSTLFISIYIISLWIISSLGASEPLTFRMLAPIWPFVLILFVDIARFSPKIFTIIFTILLIYHLIFSIRFSISKNNSGAGGYNSDDWHNSEVINFIKSNPEHLESSAANAADAIILHLNKQIPSLPWRFDNEGISTFLSQPPKRIIWFDHVFRKSLIDKDDMLKSLAVTDTLNFKDGQIYLIQHR